MEKIIKENCYIFDAVILNPNHRRDPAALDRKIRNYARGLTANERNAHAKEKIQIHRAFIRYALTYYEGWTPDEAIMRFNADVARKYCLESSIRIATPPPPEIPDQKRYQYAASCAFDRYDENKAIELYYLEFLRRRRSGEKLKFPRGFFNSKTDGKGDRRANVCLRIAVRDSLQHGILRDIVKDKITWKKAVYEFFKVRGRSFLEDYYLLTAKCIPCGSDGGYIYPVQYLLEAFPEIESMIYSDEKLQNEYLSICKEKRNRRDKYNANRKKTVKSV